MDIYSFAMVCYEMLSGDEPLKDHEHSKFDFLISGSGMPPTLPSNPNNDPLNKLSTSCWDDVPECRPTFRDIVIELESGM